MFHVKHHCATFRMALRWNMGDSAQSVTTKATEIEWDVLTGNRSFYARAHTRSNC